MDTETLRRVFTNTRESVESLLDMKIPEYKIIVPSTYLGDHHSCSYKEKRILIPPDLSDVDMSFALAFEFGRSIQMEHGAVYNEFKSYDEDSDRFRSVYLMQPLLAVGWPTYVEYLYALRSGFKERFKDNILKRKIESEKEKPFMPFDVPQLIDTYGQFYTIYDYIFMHGDIKKLKEAGLKCTTDTDVIAFLSTV